MCYICRFPSAIYTVVVTLYCPRVPQLCLVLGPWATLSNSAVMCVGSPGQGIVVNIQRVISRNQLNYYNFNVIIVRSFWQNVNAELKCWLFLFKLCCVRILLY